MGFDLHIGLRILINKTNGLPSVWGTGSEAFTLIPFIPTDYIVPSDFRRFIDLKGKIFNAYIDTFTLEDPTSEVDCSSFLDYFPTWDTIQESSEYEDCEEYWTEKDHSEFKEAIEWFVSKGSFHVHWS